MLYLAYVSRIDHVLTNTRLYLPQEWTPDRVRRKAAGVPRKIRFHTRHEQALQMLDEQGALLSQAWVTGDDEMGESAHVRRDVNDRGEQYVLSVAGNRRIRDLTAQPPTYSGRGRLPKAPFQQVHPWRDALHESAWTKIKVRDAEQEPLEVEVVTCPVETKIAQHNMPYAETLVILRSLDETGATKYDFYLSNAPHETPQKEFARVALAAHRVEEAIKRSKSQAGLSHYEVRNWRGWHHHQVLSRMATWFLVREHHRGKKMDAGDYGPPDSRWHRHAPPSGLPVRHAHQNRQPQNTPLDPQRTSTLLPPRST